MPHHDAILPLQLKTLKLATFVMNWQKAAETAQQEGWVVTQYLSHLCELEIQRREANRLARRIKELDFGQNSPLIQK